MENTSSFIQRVHLRYTERKSSGNFWENAQRNARKKFPNASISAGASRKICTVHLKKSCKYLRKNSYKKFWRHYWKIPGYNNAGISHGFSEETRKGIPHVVDKPIRVFLHVAEIFFLWFSGRISEEIPGEYSKAKHKRLLKWYLVKIPDGIS